VTVYATYADLQAQVSDAYLQHFPDQSAGEKLLSHASDVIDHYTLGRASPAYDLDQVGVRASLAKATCAQVEFWLEVGEEHDVTALRGSLVSGRVQVHPVALPLAPRALRELQKAGFYSGTVNVK